MPQSESEVQRTIRLGASKRNWILWRNNVGKGWVAPPNRTRLVGRGERVVAAPGDVVLRQPYRVTWGLTIGASDLIGIRPLTITKKMVGRMMGQFAAAEVKTGLGRVAKKQQTFIDAVLNAGGWAGVVRGEEDLDK